MKSNSLKTIYKFLKVHEYLESVKRGRFSPHEVKIRHSTIISVELCPPAFIVRSGFVFHSCYSHDSVDGFLLKIKETLEYFEALESGSFGDPTVYLKRYFMMSSSL